ncbi:DUF2612 domain-containing protein, partial [Listeria monocytogenes]|uniref:DUF2612 domain-containing protein n=1 Tax=Listeria monocytogenes TaxID=1639 RepID=UPI002FDBC724
LRLRYYQLVSRGTVPEINAFLKLMFGDQGLVYTIDNHDMTFVTYFFTFIPDAQTKFILYNYDLLPRPAGVGVQLTFTPVNG